MKLGRPNGFAIQVEWLPCERLADRGQQATWAALRITCEGRPLTAHVAGGTVHEDVIGPASALAAWIGRSWPALIAGERVYRAARASHGHGLLEALTCAEWDGHEREIDEWLASHSLLRVGQGVLLPNAIIWRRDDVVDVSWRSDPEPRTLGVQFLNTGAARLPAEDLFQTLRDFVGAVWQQIRSSDDRSQSRAEVKRAHECVNDVHSIENLAARVGRTPSSLKRWLSGKKKDPLTLVTQAYGIEKPATFAAETLDSPIARAARSASPSFSERDHESLLKLGAKLRKLPAALGLKALRAQVPAIAEPADEDFARGYSRAERVRPLLEVARTQRLDVEPLLRRLGCAVEDIRLDDFMTDGLALWSREGQTLVAANTSSPRTIAPWGRQAMFAHELFHLLFDASQSRFFGESTNEWTATPSEREANAFAAELLLPIAEARPQDDLDAWKKEIARLQKTYGTGRELTIRHLSNRGKMPDQFVVPLLNDPA
ncbi:MAG: ImmA/IrrE family metallo-endopeptidase [Deltaproteobacteria bacterium]|nr:ImmA/IrrE family metallo-endopeptidase [Deltaproteobacteria bacterium]